MRKKGFAVLVAVAVASLLIGCSGKTGEQASAAEPARQTAASPETAQPITVGDTVTDTDVGEMGIEANTIDGETGNTPATAGDDVTDPALTGTFDESWEELVQLGLTVTENGVTYIVSTVPWDYVGEVTQETLDASAGETYTSALLNSDGSVTYKMTKAQREKTLFALTGRYDRLLSQTVESGQYTVTSITHNADFSAFEVTLSTDEIGTEESYYALDLYAMGEEFSIYAGREGERYVVSFYNPNGELIETYDSSMMV